MKPNYVILDPNNLVETMYQLQMQYALDDDTAAYLRRIIALLPRPSGLYVDEANAMLFEDLQLADKFSFDTEMDALALYTHDPDALIDATIELAMYLRGFATMIGSVDGWVTEFTIGCWRIVRNRIKRQLGIPHDSQPRGVVGLPPQAETDSREAYPFKQLASRYDFASFHQMVVLAARDDVAVYFPSDTHSKVLAVYVYMRRAMHEVSQSLMLKDHQTFNTRLIEAVRRMEVLFKPAELPMPGEGGGLRHHNADDILLPPALDHFMADRDETSQAPDADDPFARFIEDLLAGDEDSGD